MIDRANGMYDVLPVAMAARRQVSMLFAATMIGFLLLFFGGRGKDVGTSTHAGRL